MREDNSRPDLVSAMLDPGFYAHSPPTVELRETHTSWVLLAGDLAYKVKKPVTFPFLDYGTLERRHHMCREEVRLNRRLAPRIYLGVLGIVRSGDRLALVPEDEPGAVEYAVEMRRVEEARSLEALARHRALEPRHVEAIARLVARFHVDAPLAAPQRRTIEALVEPLEENLDTLRASGEDILGRDVLDAAEGFTHGFVSAPRAGLEDRARTLIRECHGDLRAEHAIVPERGAPYVYDCIEFSAGLREIDVAADLAFLVMDLARLGAEQRASELVAAYRAAGGDPGDDPLIAFHASYRAWVRAKIACLRAGQLAPGSPERAAQADEAHELFRLGRRFAWRARLPLVLVLCGVSASGKTTLGRELSDLAGLDRISSDVVRKSLAGLAPTERAEERHYSAEFTRRTYRELGEQAGRALERDAGAIVDATFHLRAERDAFRDGLGDRVAPVLFVECQAPRDVLLDRVRQRAPDPERVSDADAAIVERQLAELDPLAEISEERRAVIATEVSPDRLAVEVELLVDARIWETAEVDG
jgi:uncharacterized protein